MSLVNDMLRDLDQRRRDSDGTSARVKLTPASEYKREGGRNMVPMIAIGLILLAGGLGFAWLQLSDSPSTQQLDLAAQPAPNSTMNVETVQAAPRANPAINEAAGSTPAVASNASNAAAVLANESALAVETAIPVQTAPPTNSATNQQNQVATPVIEIASVVPATVAVANIAPDSSAANLNAPMIEEPGRIHNLTNAATEQIKDVREPSPELKDTMVVQEALRLIATNQPTQAYAKLEQHLLSNPHAHQSRETYAKFLLNDGNVQVAYNLVEQGIQLAPNHSGFKKVKARMLIGNNQITEAVELLVSRAPSVASDLEYHEILASAQLASKDYAGAVLSYTGLVQQDQEQGRWWYGFAASQDALGNELAARQAYSRAVEKPNLSANLRRRSQDRLTALGR